MTSQEAKAALDELEYHCRKLCDIAKTAHRNRKSLTGNNFYERGFHEADVALTKAEAKLKPVIAAAELDGEETRRLSGLLGTLRLPTATDKQRNEALKQVRMTCRANVLPAIEAMTASPVPHTEQVLPLDVVRGTRKYVEKVVIQANGCYEHQWFDACSVMIRRLVETLIIELYEAKGKSSEIQDDKGNYHMLGRLVATILADPSWNLGRETKTTLPEIKSLGDRSAHNRRYSANRGDIDKVQSGLRVTVDDLLHLAGLK